MPSVAVIGSGFSGLSAACCLADAGFRVTVIEKNRTPGGRARQLKESGFVFDMGPSWYWMPDIFERFFQRFGRSVEKEYNLVRLDPSYRVFFGPYRRIDVPANLEALKQLYESFEPGSGTRLEAFLAEAGEKYQLAVNRLLYNPGLSVMELMDPGLISRSFRFDVFRSMTSHIRKYFRHPALVQMLEFPVLFLGAAPWKTPALYSLMNYADISLGTWYPMGGMYEVVDAMVRLARSLGVDFQFNQEVQRFEVDHGKVTNVWCGGSPQAYDYVVASADYHHVEQELLPSGQQRYSHTYWKSRTMAPSAIIFYLGLNGRVPNLLHHNLFFDEDLRNHAEDLYETPRWPRRPLFYVSCPSKTDPAVAPNGMENLFVLIPVAPGLEDSAVIREHYYELIMERIARHIGSDLRPSVVYKKDYAQNDFIQDYHAFPGNAYGLANTLNQTANLKPAIVNNRISNLFYTGQLTVPGPGVPPAIVSGQVAADQLIKRHRTVAYA